MKADFVPVVGTAGVSYTPHSLYVRLDAQAVASLDVLVKDKRGFTCTVRNNHLTLAPYDGGNRFGAMTSDPLDERLRVMFSTGSRVLALYKRLPLGLRVKKAPVLLDSKDMRIRIPLGDAVMPPCREGIEEIPVIETVRDVGSMSAERIALNEGLQDSLRGVLDELRKQWMVRFEWDEARMTHAIVQIREVRR